MATSKMAERVKRMKPADSGGGNPNGGGQDGSHAKLEDLKGLKPEIIMSMLVGLSNAHATKEEWDDVLQQAQEMSGDGGEGEGGDDPGDDSMAE